MNTVKLSCLRANLRVEKDFYSEFVGDFVADINKECELYIACDSVYAVYLNGKLLAFGQCADYPHKRYCDRVAFKPEKTFNELRVEVWYMGESSFTYIVGKPFVAFKVNQSDNALIESDEKILSRLMSNYKNGYCKKLTLQLGYSFYYDNTRENSLPLDKSVVIGDAEFEVRPIDGLVLRDRPKIDVVKQKDGYLIDLKRETAGFIDIDLESSEEQEILIAYGEHVENGNVSRIIEDRDFSVEIKLKKGKNVYLNPFRRLAGRYLQVFCKSPLSNIYIGIRPVERNVEEIKRRFDDELLQKIYDTSVYTLKCCMHEHYEDCPWREQALYNLDSRNQMLCGYYAFKGFDFQRHNLVLMAHAKPEGDGFMPLCFPAEFDRYIPFFSLAYVMQVYEYVKYSGDKSVLDGIVGERVKEIVAAFKKRIGENNLIYDVPLPAWNFYEWTAGSSGGDDDSIDDKPFDKSGVCDLILNCAYVYTCGLYDELFGLKTDVEKIKKAIVKEFYDKEKGLFKFDTAHDLYTQLGNSMAILAGVAEESVAEKMLVDDSDIVKVSLSTSTFFYDALLCFGDKYKNFVLNDIKEKYSGMLDFSATTFWETENVFKDFTNGAGSLCHGWSAIPVYYLCLLANPKN